MNKPKTSSSTSLTRASARSILLMQTIGGSAELERLLQDEARLRQRSFRGVDQQHHAVDHRQRALHLAAEVGVAGRVDDVDLHAAVLDGGVLGEDRDAALALEVVRVHHSLHDVLVGAEDAALVQHRVDQRGLAVVDVGDDGDVADIGTAGDGRVHESPTLTSAAVRRGDQRRTCRCSAAADTRRTAGALLLASP